MFVGGGKGSRRSGNAPRKGLQYEMHFGKTHLGGKHVGRDEGKACGDATVVGVPEISPSSRSSKRDAGGSSKNCVWAGDTVSN